MCLELKKRISFPPKIGYTLISTEILTQKYNSGVRSVYYMDHKSHRNIATMSLYCKILFLKYTDIYTSTGIFSSFHFGIQYMAEFLFMHENKSSTLRPLLHKIKIFHIYCMMKAQNISVFSTAHAFQSAVGRLEAPSTQPSSQCK